MNHFIIVSGPTAVGKTAFVEGLGSLLPMPYDIINADMGQLYTPLSIGTAKPLYRNSPLPHYLFDVIDTPSSYTAHQWREAVIALMAQSWNNKRMPVIVGGSSFYIASLFFPPSFISTSHEIPTEWSNRSSSNLWEQLHEIDPIRALSLHKNDRYRIERALIIWLQGKIPSSCEPTFQIPGTCSFYYLMREKEELHKRINERVIEMLEQGWIDEVRSLDAAWIQFLNEKKLIGYPDIISYLQGSGAQSYKELTDSISLKTRSYAKRQVVFWRMLKKKLETHDPDGNLIKKIVELHPTTSFHDGFLCNKNDIV